MTIGYYKLQLQKERKSHYLKGTVRVFWVVNIDFVQELSSNTIGGSNSGKKLVMPKKSFFLEISLSLWMYQAPRYINIIIHE